MNVAVVALWASQNALATVLVGIVAALLGVLGTLGSGLLKSRNEGAQVAINGMNILLGVQQQEILRLNTRIGQLEAALRAAGIPVP